MSNNELKGTGKVVLQTEHDAFEFRVTRDGDFVGRDLEGRSCQIKNLRLKPNFQVVLESGMFYTLDEYQREHHQERSLIQGLYADADVFESLVAQDKIIYTIGVANDFNLPLNTAIDYYENRGAFKRQRKQQAKQRCKR